MQHVIEDVADPLQQRLGAHPGLDVTLLLAGEADAGCTRAGSCPADVRDDPQLGRLAVKRHQDLVHHQVVKRVTQVHRALRLHFASRREDHYLQMVGRVPGQGVKSILQLPDLVRGDIRVTGGDVYRGNSSLGEIIQLEFLLLQPGDNRQQCPLDRRQPVGGFPSAPVWSVQHDIRAEQLEFLVSQS